MQQLVCLFKSHAVWLARICLRCDRPARLCMWSCMVKCLLPIFSVLCCLSIFPNFESCNLLCMAYSFKICGSCNLLCMAYSFKICGSCILLCMRNKLHDSKFGKFWVIHSVVVLELMASVLFWALLCVDVFQSKNILVSQTAWDLKRHTSCYAYLRHEPDLLSFSILFWFGKI